MLDMEGSRICGNLQVSPLLVISESYPQLGLVKLETPRNSALAEFQCCVRGSGWPQAVATQKTLWYSGECNRILPDVPSLPYLTILTLCVTNWYVDWSWMHRNWPWPTWLLGPLGYFAPQHRARTTSHGDLPQAQRLCAVEEPRPATADRWAEWHSTAHSDG